jgi:hypothetical protein
VSLQLLSLLFLLSQRRKFFGAKIREIVKFFRYSPKNEVLQKYVVQELYREISLMHDVKTICNSLADIVERFLLLEACIDLKSNIELSLNEKKANNPLDILKPIKIVIKQLSSNDCYLWLAEITNNCFN